MQDTIRARLSDIERSENVRIVYACESGSRAWGFPSADSDYDVRFLYVHAPEWYLSIETRRDVIEYAADGALDINGWDLRKALRLFRKSNAPLFEWLGSPIRYLERTAAAGTMRELAPAYYSPAVCARHYLHVAQRSYSDYLDGDQVRVKQCFYVLRPLLAAQWLEQGLGSVPTEFALLVDRLVTSPELRAAIEQLVQVKRDGVERDRGPRVALIQEFLTAELARLQGREVDPVRRVPPLQPLDELFRAALKQAW